MGLFKWLFGGQSGPTERFTVYYVQPKRCDEIIAVRIDRNNDPSETDEGGYFVRKVARGERCPFAAELHITYDRNKREVSTEVQDGALVDEAAYQAWAAAQ